MCNMSKTTMFSNSNSHSNSNSNSNSVVFGEVRSDKPRARSSRTPRIPRFSLQAWPHKHDMLISCS